MAGRRNVIEYVFQGDTLDLEQAINRVTKLMNASSRNFKKFQDGMITPSQQEQLKRLRRLRDELKGFASPTAQDALLAKGNEDALRQVDARAKQAINDAISLHKQSLKMDDKEFDQKKTHQQILTADQKAFYQSMAGQMKAESQSLQLTRMANLTRPTIGEAQYENIISAIENYNKLNAAYSEGKVNTEDLIAATAKLDKMYKQYATTLQRVKVEQKELNKGPEKKASLLEQLFGKFKSITLYRLARLAVQAILTQLRAGLEGIAKKNSFFNNTMSELLSTFKYVGNQVSSVLAPTLSIITPILRQVSQAVSEVTNRVAAMMSVFAGDDNVAIATYQLDDYVESLKKANKGMKGIDELNVTETTDAESDYFKLVTTESVLGDNIDGMKSIASLLKDLANLVGNVLNPVMEVLGVLLVQIGAVVGNLFVALEPIFKLIVSIVSVVAQAVGGVLVFLVNYILAPIVNWLGYIIGHVELLIPLIVTLLALLALFKGKVIIETLSGIALGFKNVALAIWSTIKAIGAWIAKQAVMIATNIKNAVSAWIAAKQYWKLAIAIVATAGLAAIAVIGVIGAASAAGEARANSSLGAEPHLARGGIIKQPTLALVGEGRYNEAVIPLGDSPQFEDMKTDIAEKVVNAGGSGNSNRPIILNINGKELARTILPDLQYALPQTGMKLRRS